MSTEYKDVMSIPKMEEIIEKYKSKSTFQRYNSFDVANSYKYLGAKMQYSGKDYYFSSKNLAIFFFVVHDEIQQDERNKILELFTTGYQKGYDEIETALSEKLGLQERSHDNVQKIVCKMYVELHKKYEGWLYSVLERFYAAGYNQGQLHRLKIMMQGLDEVGDYNELGKAPFSNSYPISLLTLEPNECLYLYKELTKNGYFLPKDTDQAHFNYVFGGGVCPEDFKPICWNVSKQALAELIIFIVGKKAVPRSIQRNVRGVFVDSVNVPIASLSNPKKDEPSSDYGVIDNITKPLKTIKPRS